jgi:hypothetical protein
MSGWNTFAQISGGAAAAQIGLVFVAVSIRVDVIARNVALRSRAGQTLILYGQALLITILLSTPRQAYAALGSELVTLAVVSGVGLIALDRIAKAHPSGDPLVRLLDLTNTNTLSTLLLLVTGALLVADVRQALYILVGCVLAELIGGATSAWLLLIRTTSTGAAKQD